MAFEGMALDELIRLEDALDFIRRGFTRADHVSCFKPQFQAEEAAAFDVAMEMVRKFHSARKVQAEVSRQIEGFREVRRAPEPITQ